MRALVIVLAGIGICAAGGVLAVSLFIGLLDKWIGLAVWCSAVAGLCCSIMALLDVRRGRIDPLVVNHINTTPISFGTTSSFMKQEDSL